MVHVDYIEEVFDEAFQIAKAKEAALPRIMARPGGGRRGCGPAGDCGGGDHGRVSGRDRGGGAPISWRGSSGGRTT